VSFTTESTEGHGEEEDEKKGKSEARRSLEKRSLEKRRSMLMSRIRAVLCVGLGLALIGVALGLLYMDVREHAAVQLMVQAQGAETAEQKAAAVQGWKKSDRVMKAMMAGACGAGLVGMGLMLGVFEFQRARREASR